MSMGLYSNSNVDIHDYIYNVNVGAQSNSDGGNCTKANADIIVKYWNLGLDANYLFTFDMFK